MNQNIDNLSFETIGIIKNEQKFDLQKLERFVVKINELKSKKKWNVSDFIILFSETLPNFNHISKGKNLENRM